MAAGRDFSALAPNIRRAMWGIINPTQPITPLIAVRAAAADTMETNKTNLVTKLHDIFPNHDFEVVV